MEEAKAQALCDTLAKLQPRRGLGVSSHYNFGGAASKDGKAPVERTDGLPNNALYSNFVREGAISDADRYGDGRKIKRNFDDCLGKNIDDDSSPSKNERKRARKEEKKAVKRAAKLESKKKEKLEEKRRKKMELSGKKVKKDVDISDDRNGIEKKTKRSREKGQQIVEDNSIITNGEKTKKKEKKKQKNTSEDSSPIEIRNVKEETASPSDSTPEKRKSNEDLSKDSKKRTKSEKKKKNKKKL